MAGSEPIWLVTGGGWGSAETPVKSVWVLSRPAGGGLVATGRRIGDGIRLRFRDPVEDEPTERLSIPHPGTRSVIPGGSTPEILERYAFLPFYLIFPAPGCWEISARLGDRERRIVLEVGTQPEPP